MESPLSITLADNKFDLVVEKGTIDAMLCAGDSAMANARAIIGEAVRVLNKASPCGVASFWIVSHLEVGYSYVV
jgi:hypothetical protein